MEANLSLMAFDDRLTYFHSLVERYEDRLPVLAHTLPKHRPSAFSTL